MEMASLLQLGKICMSMAESNDVRSQIKSPVSLSVCLFVTAGIMKADINALPIVTFLSDLASQAHCF